MSYGNEVFDPSTGTYVELTDRNAAQVAPQVAAEYAGISRTTNNPLSPFVHPGGRRELRAALASREVKTYYKEGNARLGGMSTMPVRRAQEKRPAGVSARQAKRARVAERQAVQAAEVEWQAQAAQAEDEALTLE